MPLVSARGAAGRNLELVDGHHTIPSNGEISS